MKKISRNSIHSLQEEAEKSGDNEAFTVLAKIGDCRIGTGVRLESPKEPTYFIEARALNYMQIVISNIFETKKLLILRLGALNKPRIVNKNE